MGAMRLPDFISSALGQLGFTYDHLRRDEWAVTLLNLTVASAESELLGKRDWSDSDIFEWHDTVAKNLDPEGDLRIAAPPPWKAGVSYGSSVMESLCEVISTKAESADELIRFPDLLQHLGAIFAGHYFAAHLDNWGDAIGVRTAFIQFVGAELHPVQKLQTARAWQLYHARLNGTLQSGPSHSRETERKARERSLVVLPLLEARKWSPNRWAKEAGVGKNCPYEYLAGSRDLTENNRRAMAEALGLTPEQLPNG
jgi:hypothetical protein